LIQGSKKNRILNTDLKIFMSFEHETPRAKTCNKINNHKYPRRPQNTEKAAKYTG
jgi:hypothetical protein